MRLPETESTRQLLHRQTLGADAARGHIYRDILKLNRLRKPDAQILDRQLVAPRGIFYLEPAVFDAPAQRRLIAQRVLACLGNLYLVPAHGHDLDDARNPCEVQRAYAISRYAVRIIRRNLVPTALADIIAAASDIGGVDLLHDIAARLVDGLVYHFPDTVGAPVLAPNLDIRAVLQAYRADYYAENDKSRGGDKYDFRALFHVHCSFLISNSLILCHSADVARAMSLTSHTAPSPASSAAPSAMSAMPVSSPHGTLR